MRFIVKSDVVQEYWMCDAPEIALAAYTQDEFTAAIDSIEQLQADGYFVATCLSYEAAKALDKNLSVHPPNEFPLLILLASRKVERGKLPSVSRKINVTHQPRIAQTDYQEGYQKLLDLIYAGDLYQANYSFRCDVNGVSDGYHFFCQLEKEHPAPYSAFIEFEQWQIVSLSPELFLQREGQTIISEPMKGTAPRGLSFEEDEQQKAWLINDKKNRAENLMIVDLMRNDLGRVCEPHSICVPKLFAAKRFPSLFQLVSEVRGTLSNDAKLIDILKATYPAGSITGAPKVRAMEVIKALESDCRNAYTGSIGMFLPNGDFRLNVAIRTLTLRVEVEDKDKDKDTGSEADSPSKQVELGIGSGVVSHSSGPDEWHECLLKGQFLNYRSAHTEVFETLLWSGDYHWLDDHLDRLANSCEYFGIETSITDVQAELQTAAVDFSDQHHRVRLAVDRDGKIKVKSQPLVIMGWGDSRIKLTISRKSVDETNQYQYHKTDQRQHYDDAYADAVANGFSEALFFNQKGELAEGAITNVFLHLDGSWITPNRSAGLLDGIWRRHTIEAYDASEVSVTRQMLLACDQIVIGNSVRLETQVSEVFDDGHLVWTADKNG